MFHPKKKKYIYIYIYILWESKNLGPCSGLKYYILSTMRPRRGNHGETSQLTVERVSVQGY